MKTCCSLLVLMVLAGCSANDQYRPHETKFQLEFNSYPDVNFSLNFRNEPGWWFTKPPVLQFSSPVLLESYAYISTNSVHVRVRANTLDVRCFLDGIITNGEKTKQIHKEF